MKTETNNTSNLNRVLDLQVRLESLAGVARIAADACEDDVESSGALSVIEREIQAVRADMDSVIREGKPAEGKPASGTAFNRSKLAAAINAAVAMSEQETNDVINGVLSVLNRQKVENDGPAQAMSILYEANDLLNAMRTVDTEGDTQMSSSAWTLMTEVSSRVNRAIAQLDGAVPAPGDDAGEPAARRDAEATESHEIPQFLGKGNLHDRHMDDHFASVDSAKDLKKAKSRLLTASDLLATLRGGLREAQTDETMQAANVVAEVEKHIEKVQNRLDRHESQYSNLFIAYFDLKRKGA